MDPSVPTPDGKMVRKGTGGVQNPEPHLSVVKYPSEDIGLSSRDAPFVKEVAICPIKMWISENPSACTWNVNLKSSPSAGIGLGQYPTRQTSARVVTPRVSTPEHAPAIAFPSMHSSIMIALLPSTPEE